MSEKANRILNNVEKVKTEAGMDLMYSGGSNHYETNMDLRINNGSGNFLQMGVADIGAGNRVNFQLGQQGRTFGGRIGVVEGQAGAGVDVRFGRDFKISADVYDPNDLRIKLRSEIRIAPSTYLVGESLNINKDAQRSSYIGVRRTF